jgi:inhibitor of cysteine peptidase
MRRQYPLVFCALTVLLIGVLVYSCFGTGTPSADSPKKFGSPEELDRYVREHSQTSFANDMVSGVREATGIVAVKQSGTGSQVPLAVPAATSAASVGTDLGNEVLHAKGGSGEAQDYSQTNVQVAGVDEPDFVKNDGRYIYLISNGQLVIADAYPGETAAIVSKTDLDGTPEELFLNGDRLFVISNDYSYGVTRSGPENRKVYSEGPSTRIDVYSVADHSNPDLIGGYTADGSYVDARMIGDYVYVVSKSPIILTDEPVPMPVIRTKETNVMTPDVYYFDNPERQFVFHTISSVDINDPGIVEARTFLLGYSDTLYVSGNNMYISYPRPFGWQPKPALEPDDEFMSSALSPSAARVPDLSDPDIMDRFNKMSDDDKQAFIQDLQGAGGWQSYETDRTSTAIHKFSIDEGRIEYVAEGIVKGNLLNQFSMDEYNGDLRVATTSDVSTPRNSYQYNNVIVLDPEMKETGSLTHLAMNEKIYSARFMGNRLYLVTFKRMDPFFVIDMSDPRDIRVLGKLKIPGYSDYLHPYDDAHIIGVGKETGTNSWGGVSTGGVKIALFDVSDPDHPKQLSTYEIGGAGSDSPALRDHKAFLFSKEKNLLVLPVSVVNRSMPAVQKGNTMPLYQQSTWQGAYVFGFTPKYGIVLKGTISHTDTKDDNAHYQSPSEITRSLYIGDELSTISERFIRINSLKDLNNILATIDLGDEVNTPIFS